MILDCGHEPSPCSNFTNGYGIDMDDKKYCYTCCAERDKADMIATGKATLYLIRDGAKQFIVNWPSSYRVPVGQCRIGRHNLAGKRYDVWFTGPEGATWHGVTYGDNTQICHCRRVKGWV